MKKTTPCPSTVVTPKVSSESAAECFISTALTPLLYELSVANAPLPAADCRDIADKIGARIGGVINRVQTVLAQLETIDTTALAAKGLYEEANAISRARVFIDRLIGFQDTASASALSQDAPDNSPASLPESSSVESSAAPTVELSGDQKIVHPLLAQLLTTWSCMILDYNGTVERMKAASRPHDAARYEAKMETIAWCSRELTAVAKRLPQPSTSSVAEDVESVDQPLPCLCGSKPEITTYIESLEGDDLFPLHIHCAEENDCTMRPDISARSRDDAIAKWNAHIVCTVKDVCSLVLQLCSDLNDAHNEILREQGVPVDKLGNYDWPEWTPQANSIRWAEGLLKKKLAKTNNWTLYPATQVAKSRAASHNEVRCSSKFDAE